MKETTDIEMYYESIPVISTGKCKLCGKKMTKHVIKEGARYHIHRYSLMSDQFGKYSITDCSTKDCEDNHGYGKCVPRTQKSVNETKKILKQIEEMIKRHDS